MNLVRVVVLAVAVVSALPGSGAPLFRKALPIDIGEALGEDAGPLVSADFNRDGFPDVAAMHLDGRLAVALDNGTGPFAATRFNDTGVLEVISMAAGDIDGDGDTDLVYASEGIFGTLVGNGDGTFAAGIALDSSGGFVGLGDFNGDGKLDGVTASDDPRDPTSLSLHFGNGTGGFAAAVTMPIPQAATGLAVARLDGNALDDVIVTSVVSTRVWTAQPGGGMQLVATLHGGVGLTTGRFDADSNTDVAIVDLVNRVASLYVLTGNGDGTFTSRATYPLPEDGPIVCADIDADGFNDLVTSSAVLTVFRGLGTGAFDAPQLSPITPDSQLAVADFDRDGHADLVTLQALPAVLEFVKGDGDATFGPDRMHVLRTPPVLDDDAEGAAVDVDSDGHPDVVTLVDNGTTRSLAVLRNDGSGGFLAPVFTPAAISTSTESTMVVGRVDGDAYPDAVVVGTEGGVVRAITFLGGAGGTFTRGASILAPFPDDVPRPRLADVTGDGMPDLLIDFTLMAGNGSGAFAAPVVRPVTCNVVADFNGDGKRDLVGLDSNTQLAIALNSGGGNFGVPVVLGPEFGEVAYVAADFNGDGKTDLFSMTDWPKTRVRLGHGDGTFDAPLEVIVPYFADEHEVKAADFDGDGKLDVSFSSIVLLGNGDGRFRALEVGSLTLDQSGVADFDGNGTLDLCSFGDVVTVRLAGLVPEPLLDPSTTLTAPATAAYAETVQLIGRTAGTVVPVTGSMAIAIDGAPYVIWGVWPAAATPPATAARLASWDSLPVGTHTMSVTYSGDQSWRSATASRQIDVDRAITSLTVTKWTGTSYGDDLVYSVPLTAPELSGSPGPTGQRVVRKGATALSVTWNVDLVSIRGLDAGTHLLTFEYPGDANYKPFTKDVSLTLAKRDPSPQWTVLPAGQPQAGPITAKATFNPGVYGAATGTATLTFEGQAPRGVTVTNGSAESTATMAAGTWVVTVDYPGDANYLPISATREVVVYGGAFGAPIALSATVRNGVADVQWTPLTGVARYDLYRRSTFDGSWELVTNTTRARINANITAGTTREWSVIPRSTNNNNAGARSATDLATNVTFTDDPAAVATRIRAVQLNELRTAVNALRTFARLPAFTFTDSLSTGFAVKALHITQLRTALAEARSAIGKPVTFGESVAAGTRSKATHLEEIRNGVR